MRKGTPLWQLTNLFDRLGIDGASLPYWPEMLDFDLPENEAAEKLEIEAYLATFERAK